MLYIDGPVAELVDALDSKSGVLLDVRVQVPLGPPMYGIFASQSLPAPTVHFSVKKLVAIASSGFVGFQSK